MKVLLDTNILIDYFGEHRAYYSDALKLRVAADFGDIELWATSNSFTDTFYILKKDHNSQSVQELFLANKGLLSICSVTAEDICLAAEEGWPDFEDCLVYVCARKTKADYILSRDKDGFARSSIPCLSPSEFFVAFEERTGISYAEVFAELAR
ncbi:MAG: PIN domain-containing protein [Coriobacteriia bacterium]|nr:PIN domain-containing protein [Coriobacteriia bacterium]